MVLSPFFFANKNFRSLCSRMVAETRRLKAIFHMVLAVIVLDWELLNVSVH